MVPPVTTVSVPGRVPAAWHIGTTMGICSLDTPKELRRSPFQPLFEYSIPSDAVTPLSIAGRPERALVATAWQGQ